MRIFCLGATDRLAFDPVDTQAAGGIEMGTTRAIADRITIVATLEVLE